MSISNISAFHPQEDCTTVPGVKRAPASVDEWEPEKVGHRIGLLREALGFQQNTLASMMGRGMTPQKINNYESGRNQIPPHWAGRLCAVTGCNFDYLYQGRMGSLPGDLIEKLGKAEKALAAKAQAASRVKRA